MRDASAHHWQRWRVTLAASAPVPKVDWSARLRMPTPATAPAGAPRDEEPGPDGIRHELVARIRREIAAGTYDTEEKWLAAEAELLRRIEERM
jgi:Anti-sigma-28 factor, FlgM